MRMDCQSRFVSTVCDMHDGENTALYLIKKQNKTKREMILELEAKLSLKRKKNLRDIGEGAPQVITNGVNVVPLFFGHGGTDVIGQHLSLVKQPLENEQRRC